MFSVLDTNLTFAICNGKTINATVPAWSSTFMIGKPLRERCDGIRKRIWQWNKCNSKNPPERNIEFVGWNWKVKSEKKKPSNIRYNCILWPFSRPFSRSTNPILLNDVGFSVLFRENLIIDSKVYYLFENHCIAT